MAEIIEKLDGLIEQATKERSHYYVESVAVEAKEVILYLMSRVEQQSDLIDALHKQ